MPAGGCEAGTAPSAIADPEAQPAPRRQALDQRGGTVGSNSRAGLLGSRCVNRVPRWLLALAFYVATALITIGRHALSHPTTTCACLGNGDSAAYTWGLSWWPHAITHGLNPFVTHYMWSPVGLNVARTAMIPTAALVMAPITALSGPFVSYNILSIASPALAAFTTYLLCRRLIKRELPSLAGGYLFGFSSYEFVQLLGHLNLTLVFLIPVIVHVCLRRAAGELSRAWYVPTMALLFVLQAGLSTELLAECVAFGALLLICARMFVRRAQRSQIDGLIAETIGAGILAFVVASPFFYYAVISGGAPMGSPLYWENFGLDLLNLAFPTSTTWLGHHDFMQLSSSYEISDITETDGYLSIPLMIAFGLWLTCCERRSLLVRLLAIAAGVSLVMAMGAHLHVAGHGTVALPADLVKASSIFDNFIPSRMILFTTLAMAVGVAAWLAMSGGALFWRWLTVALVAVLVFPNLTSSLYGGTPSNPSFFSTATYRRYLTPGETVLALPFGAHDQSALWQAETGFYFYMPGGYLSNFVPPSFGDLPIMNNFLKNSSPPASELGSFIRQHYVSDVVVDDSVAGVWPALLAQLGLHGQLIGGVLLYRVPDAPA